MKLLVAAAVALAAVGALVGRSTAAGSQTVAIKLPKHVFGHPQTPADIRMVQPSWGKAPGHVGLVQEEAGPSGGASFDAFLGTVCVLDQHNSRVLVYTPDEPVRAVPLVVKGAAGSVFRAVDSSLAVDEDGRIYVLEPVDSLHRHPTLWSFSAKGGAPIASVATAGTNPIVRASGKTVYVSQLVSGPWQQVMVAGKPKHGPATPYRDFGGGVHVLLQQGFKQPIKVTLVPGNGSSTSWSVTSPDHVSPVDVEPFGNNLVLVLMISTQTKNEYEVLDLGKQGLVNAFSVPYDHYAETALFDDFRMDVGALFHRGSTKRGLYVDSYVP